MLKTGWHLVMTTLLLVMALMLAGCGGGGGGEGALSSAATLGLAVNKTTVASGTDTVTATVTLTSLNSQPVNGVSVTVDMTYNNAVVGSYSGNTNTNGIAAIVVPVALVPADRTVYLQARSSGITSSSSLAVAVKAPVITVTLADASVTDVSGATFTGAGINFADYNNNGLANTTITFTYTSSSGSAGTLSHSGTPLAIGDSFNVTTDSSGYATIALAGSLNAMPPSGSSDTATFNYTVSVVYGAYTYTKQGSVSVTVTSS